MSEFKGLCLVLNSLPQNVCQLNAKALDMWNIIYKGKIRGG